MTGLPIDRAYNVQTGPKQTDGGRTSVAPATGITREMHVAMRSRVRCPDGATTTRDSGHHHELPKRHPYDGKLLKTFENLTDKQLDKAIAATATCFETWRRTRFAERGAIVAQLGAVRGRSAP